MIRYDEALAILLAVGRDRPLGSETLALAQIPGRIAAADVRAPMAQQPFDNSAMDGFALRAADAGGLLQVVERIAAGRAEAAAALKPGQCHAIMTGAPLPDGADAVVPVEHTETLPDGTLRITGQVRAGDFIRRRGADYQVGDPVLSRGTMLRPEHVLALATLGAGALEVVRAPRIAVLSTGAEVVDALGAPLGPGQIYNSSGPFLVAQLAASGCTASRVASVGEDTKAWERHVAEGAESSDLVISTGAVSMGDHDFVPEVLRRLGAEILFHRVAIRPGKPILFARLPGGVPFLGLPGNPASTAAGWQFFAKPLIAAMQGRAPEPARFGVLREAYRKGSVPLRFFMRARITYTEAGVCEVEIPERQPSFMVSPFVATNGWAVIPEDVSDLPAGAIVAIG